MASDRRRRSDDSVLVVGNEVVSNSWLSPGQRGRGHRWLFRGWGRGRRHPGCRVQQGGVGTVNFPVANSAARFDGASQELVGVCGVLERGGDSRFSVDCNVDDVAGSACVGVGAGQADPFRPVHAYAAFGVIDGKLPDELPGCWSCPRCRKRRWSCPPSFRP